MALTQYNFRMDEDLKAWLSEYAQQVGVPESQIIRDLLRDLRARVSHRPNPFPMERGTSQEFPLLIAQPEEWKP